MAREIRVPITAERIERMLVDTEALVRRNEERQARDRREALSKRLATAERRLQASVRPEAAAEVDKAISKGKIHHSDRETFIDLYVTAPDATRRALEARPVNQAWARENAQALTSEEDQAQREFLAARLGMNPKGVL